MRKLLIVVLIANLITCALLLMKKRYEEPVFHFQSEGEWIIFSCGFFTNSSSTSTSNLYIMRPDGSELQQITSNRFLATSADLSPDGSRVWFVDEAYPNIGLYELFLDGTGFAELGQLSAVRYNVQSTDWHPQNSTIVISASDELLLFDAERRTTEIVYEAGSMGTVRWNPDGTAVAFAMIPQPDRLGGIYLMDMATRSNRLLVQTAIPYMAWSTDGNELYASSRAEDNNFYLHRLNISTGELSRLPIELGRTSFDISPSGEWIVFANEMIGGLYKSRLNGEDLQKLGNLSSCYINNPRWYSFD